MRLLLPLFVVLSISAQAQFTLTGYLPSKCLASAIAALPGASDGKVLAVATSGSKIPILGSELYIGMDMNTGTAPVWMYIAYSQAQDTAVTSVFINTLGACTKPPVDEVPEPIDPSDLGKDGIPSGFLEGTELLTNLKANTDYQRFHSAHPDSVPTVVALSVTQEEALGFPQGTPVWVFLWSPSSEGLPFTCFVHAATGQTVCLDPSMSVVQTSDALAAGFSTYPNPTTDVTMVNVPTALLGSHLQLYAYDATGRAVPLYDGVISSIPVVVSTQSLTSGMWTLRANAQNNVYSLPLSVVR